MKIWTINVISSEVEKSRFLHYIEIYQLLNKLLDYSDDKSEYLVENLIITRFLVPLSGIEMTNFIYLIHLFKKISDESKIYATFLHFTYTASSMRYFRITAKPSSFEPSI